MVTPNTPPNTTMPPSQAGDLMAVIDIGSNSIRLVVYGNLGRAPTQVYWDKSLCQLGKNLEKTGLLNPAGVEKLRAVFPSFMAVVNSMGVQSLMVFATAAVREAKNGADVLDYLHKTSGVPVTVLSGEEEARFAGMGVWYGIPDADGLVADFGGGSLELAELKNGTVGDVCSLPIGALRFGDSPNISDVARHIATILKTHSFATGKSYKTLYLVGGAWRSLASQHMVDNRYPLPTVHHYTVAYQDMMDFLTPISAGMRSIDDLGRISTQRKSAVMVACLALQGVLETITVGKVTLSGYGVREGALVTHLLGQGYAFLHGATSDSETADSKTLNTNAVSHALCESVAPMVAGGQGGSLSLSHDVLYDWIYPVVGHLRHRRQALVRAGCSLVDIARMGALDNRGPQSLSTILHHPLLGITHREQAFVGYAVAWRYGKLKKVTRSRKIVRRLLTRKQKRRAKMVGASLQLAYGLSGGVESILSQFDLRLQGDTLILRGQKSMGHMIRGGVLYALETIIQSHPHIRQFEIELC